MTTTTQLKKLGAELNKQAQHFHTCANQSTLNTPLTPSERELEWIMSNPAAKAGATAVINMLRWHVHMEQLNELP